MCQIPELEYPLDWRFQIIAIANNEALPEIVTILRNQGFLQEPRPGNTSSGGKYQTYVVNVTFKDQAAKDSLTAALNNAANVKFLL